MKRALAFLVLAGVAVLLSIQSPQAQTSAKAITAPHIISVTTAGTNVFTNSVSARFRAIQNVGTVAVLLRLDGTAEATTNYHKILAPGASAGDGLGSDFRIDLTHVSVSCITASGTGSIATLEITQ